MYFLEHMQHQQLHEEAVLKQLLQLEKEFRKHNVLHLTNAEKQCIAVDRLQELNKQYLKISNDSGNCAIKAATDETKASGELLNEFYQKLLFLRNSNCSIYNSLCKLRRSCRQFELLCSQLDMQSNTSFVLGDAHHKPISYFITLVKDIFDYFHCILLKMKLSTAMIEPIDNTALQSYMQLLKPNEDFLEYLRRGLMYCHCLHPQPSCIKPTVYACLSK